MQASEITSLTLFKPRCLRWDCCLKGLFAQLWHLQGGLAGPGVELAFIAAGPGIDPLRAALIALSATQGIGIQQSVQGLLHGLPDQFPEMIVNLRFIDAHNLAQSFAIVAHGGGSPLWLLISRITNLTTGTTAFSNVRKIFYVID